MASKILHRRRNFGTSRIFGATLWSMPQRCRFRTGMVVFSMSVWRHTTPLRRKEKVGRRFATRDCGTWLIQNPTETSGWPMSLSVHRRRRTFERRRPGLGSEFTLRFDALMERIAQNPLQFPEIASGVRRALLQRFPYAIYFVVAACPVIIAVLHQRRHPHTWKQRI